MKEGVGERGTKSAILNVLAGESLPRPPIWLMRQAGRYLPEYRQVRAQAGSFLDLCYNPKLASEVTLQPITRFGFDAAIIFSDILVVPHAFGQQVGFAEGEGPRLDPVSSLGDLNRLRNDIDLNHLEPVFEALTRVKAALPAQTALIGFCGAPWTVASYMIAGKSTPDQAPARIAAYADPDFLQALIDRLVEGSIAYLQRKVEAGADVLQIFESFASALPPPIFQCWCVDPISRIVAGVKEVHPHVPIIVFARGAGDNLGRIADFADAVGLDWGVDLTRLGERVPPHVPVQGNLDPIALVAGGSSLDESIDGILDRLAGRPHIFNLGHGILPQTPIAHVEQLIRRVRG